MLLWANLDDILITTSGLYEDHLANLDKVLHCLHDTGFAVNVRKSSFAVDAKSSFAVDAIEYLGYWITCKGIQPQPKKVEAIQQLTAPKTKHQQRHFLGMVNYYHNMWQQHSHLMAPLSALVSNKTKFVWKEEQQKAFDKIKKIITKETLLAYPDFSKEFHIHTDASNVQLGAVIMQKNKPIAF